MTVKKTPRLTIETSAAGVERVIVHLAHDEPADAGFLVLRNILPALRDLDLQTRESR